MTPANISDIASWASNWSAITLARIKRTNSSIVQPADITDLRSLVDLSGQRIVDDTIAAQPPIAAQIYSNSIHFPVDVTLPYTTTAWTDWPPTANFAVPIPSWAQEVDILGTFNPQTDDDMYGRPGSGSGRAPPTSPRRSRSTRTSSSVPGPARSSS